MGGLLPMPPSSAYWIHRSASISSAAARNRRMASSPLRNLPLPDLACAPALVALLKSPTTGNAVMPAIPTPFIKVLRPYAPVDLMLLSLFMIYLHPLSHSPTTFR